MAAALGELINKIPLPDTPANRIIPVSPNSKMRIANVFIMLFCPYSILYFFISLHSHLETTFFGTAQNGFDYLYAYIFIGQQLPNNIQYTLARAFAMRYACCFSAYHIGTDTPRVADFINTPFFNGLSRKPRRIAISLYCSSKQRPHSSNCARCIGNTVSLT